MTYAKIQFAGHEAAENTEKSDDKHPDFRGGGVAITMLSSDIDLLIRSYLVGRNFNFVTIGILKINRMGDHMILEFEGDVALLPAHSSR